MLKCCRICDGKFKEIIRFCIVGGATFVLDYGLLFVFTEYCRISYLYSAAISFLVAVAVNYWLCVRYVFFADGIIGWQRQLLFVGSSIVGLFLNQACMYAFVELLGMYYMVAKLFATGIVTIWNYVMKKKAIAG